MDKKKKKEFVADFHGLLEKAQGTFLVDYKGLNVEAMNRLRRDLRNVNAELRVVKNRFMKLASQNTDTALMKDTMHGPSAIAITYEDVVAPAKVLVDFAKDFKQLEIKSGQISGKLLDVANINRLAELPSREVLLAQALSAMQGVAGSFVRVLSGVPRKLLYVLKAIENTKQE